MLFERKLKLRKNRL